MKTTTILNALELAEDYVNMFANQPEHRHYQRSLRQKRMLRSALLRRIEAGDKAREALKVFADRDKWYEFGGTFEFSGGKWVNGKWYDLDPCEFARAALGEAES